MYEVKEVKKKNRWGYDIPCSCCTARIFRTRAQYRSKPLNYCRRCTGLKGSYSAAKVNTVYTQDNSYFSKTDLQTFYWAGFLAGDGYINQKDNYVSIKLSIRDKDRLETFLCHTGCTNTILASKDKTDKPGTAPRVRVVINNKNWVNDLVSRFNITQNKSLTLKAPNDSDWTDTQRLSFIVGLIDADGCTNKFNDYVRLYCSGTKEILTYVRDFLSSYYKVSLKPTSVRHHSKDPDKNVYEMSIYCGKAERVLSGLKQVPVDKMARKWDKVEL